MAWECMQPHFVWCHTPRLTWTPGLGVSLGVWHRTKWGHIGGTAHSKAAHIPGPKPVPPPFPCRYILCTYSMLYWGGQGPDTLSEVYLISIYAFIYSLSYQGPSPRGAFYVGKGLKHHPQVPNAKTKTQRRKIWSLRV